MVTNPTRAGLHYPDSILRALAAPSDLVYTPAPLGLPRAREAVAAWYAQRGQPISADQVVITTSTSESYGHLFRLLCEPQAPVWVPSPGYPLFEELGRWSEVRTRSYGLVEADRWRMDLNAIDLAGDPGPVVVVSPNNPTGSWLHRDELSRLDAAAAAAACALIVDEVFAPYPIQPEVDAADALDAPNRALRFVLGGLSKAAGLPQLKLGWMVLTGPEPDVRAARAALEFLSDAFLSVAAPVQRALPDLLSAGATIRAQISARVVHNSSVATELFGGLGPEGGWYRPIRMPDVGIDWSRAALSEGVIVHPGWFYDLGPGWIVTSLLTPSPVYAEGLARLAQLSPS